MKQDLIRVTIGASYVRIIQFENVDITDATIKAEIRKRDNDGNLELIGEWDISVLNSHEFTMTITPELSSQLSISDDYTSDVKITFPNGFVKHYLTTQIKAIQGVTQ